ncbi:hypothetical protein [Mesorhizobium ciceri]|uniref:hypothetical protein n=1 Tax=Mesorhizobium TaxID=68287 RepID=UPI0012DE6B6F|nr:hypothetical protein [Mesorhizobium ciceri]
MEYNIDESRARNIPSPGKCIYCGITGVKLTDEHVIPFAIGKDATILDKSCCEVCQKIIQPYEQAVLKHQLGHFRAMVESPTRNKRDRPNMVTLEFVEVNDKGQAIRDLSSQVIPLSEAPLILNLWQSPPPRMLRVPDDPPDGEGRAWHYIEKKIADPILAAIASVAGARNVGIKLGRVNRLHYLRTLAKIAHAYAAAELGPDAFKPFLTEIILKRSDDVGRYVGDMAGVASLEGPTGHDYKITLGEVPEEAGFGKGIIVVFMQFWADLGSPPHLVVVGEALIDLKAQFETKAIDRGRKPLSNGSNSPG